MTIKNIFLHHLDIENNSISLVEIDENSINLKAYVNSLVNEILEHPNKRLYTFKDGNTEVKNSLGFILENAETIEETISNNAKRLLEKEIASQQKIRHLDVDIQKGSLLHLHFETNENEQIIICKVEHDEILNEVGFDLIKGLNTKKKVFKAILIFFDSENNIIENYVYDKNSSKYWWNDFLELIQPRSDEENTSKSINEIDKILNRQRKDFYSDYLIVRNAVIGYYRTNETFNFSEMVDNVLSSYEPVNPDFPLTKITDKIKKLPIDKGFDTQFGIEKKSINKRAQNKIKLANNLYLSIDDYVENLRNIIEPLEENGNKFLKIQSTDGYNALKDLLNQ